MTILIHGSGVVQAGQWARSLIINYGLDFGSQIPYVRNAMKLGSGVILMNTNNNEEDDDSKWTEKCAEAVWKNFVQPSKAKVRNIFAYSFAI